MLLMVNRSRWRVAGCKLIGAAGALVHAGHVVLVVLYDISSKATPITSDTSRLRIGEYISWKAGTYGWWKCAGVVDIIVGCWGSCGDFGFGVGGDCAGPLRCDVSVLAVVVGVLCVLVALGVAGVVGW